MPDTPDDPAIDDTLANQDYKPADDHAKPANAERFIDDAGKAKSWQAPSEFAPTPPNERIDPEIGFAPDPRVGGVPGPKRGSPPDPRTGFAPSDHPMNTADDPAPDGFDVYVASDDKEKTAEPPLDLMPSYISRGGADVHDRIAGLEAHVAALRAWLHRHIDRDQAPL